MNIRYLPYRWTSIIMHRFDLHYAPIHGPYQDGRKQRWCQWCGMRDWYIEPLVTADEIRRAAKQLGITASQSLHADTAPALTDEHKDVCPLDAGEECDENHG